MSCVFFIGGASASGKTTVALKLATTNSLSLIHLDAFYNTLRPAFKSDSDLEVATKSICQVAATHILAIGRKCILDGGWIDPEVAVALFGPSAAIYCGYEDKDLGKRYDRILSKNEHWLKDESKENALSFLQKQADGSEWYKSECKECNLPYVDFTNFPNHIPSEISSRFSEWFNA
ncbi:AAA family ATPase [Haliea sp. E1-2-M8]|uniref:AAA family ATPase n=1 Tax=Haliea sp. E1-2-M8 TaxID=3064706 RepID=UPI002723204B|nr:AAA family ATPase [Haliea sp. E1-2-M8]MDO8863673.1 AAA family ATPase [Haliea sp. E1-2-M8]